MKWSDEYSTGVERIDNQHKMLFRMSEDFRTSLDDGLGDRIYDGS
jgi:hemerythrin